MAADAEYQWFWAEVPYYHDGPVDLPAPGITLAAHVGWTHPVVWSEVTADDRAAAGRLQVFDGGYQKLFGAQVGGGLGMATDGAAGAVLVGTVLGPMVEGRVEAMRWHRDAPRLLDAGPRCR